MSRGDRSFLDEIASTIAPQAVSIKTARLLGGVSADTFLMVATQRDGSVNRYVVRRRTSAPGNGEISLALEYTLLERLYDEGMMVARPRMLASSDTVVMDWVEGTTTLPSYGPRAMASALVAIHAYRGEALDILPPREDPLPVVKRAIAEHDMLEDDEVHQGLEDAEACLLHGDFWPGNVLWHRGELAAILDWEDAAIGDPLSDVACAIVELDVAHGEAAGSQFRSVYFEQSGRREERLPMWEIYVTTTALSSMDQWGLPQHELVHRRTVTRRCRERALAHF